MTLTMLGFIGAACILVVGFTFLWIATDRDRLEQEEMDALKKLHKQLEQTSAATVRYQGTVQRLAELIKK